MVHKFGDQSSAETGSFKNSHQPGVAAIGRPVNPNLNHSKNSTILQSGVSSNIATLKRKGGDSDHHLGGYGPGDNTNASLPDISSTDMAPNKLHAPNKIININ